MLLEKVADTLSKVKGVQAVALGGSQSRGEAGPLSDYDLGLYYQKDALDLQALETAMTALDDKKRAGLLNPPGAWGPWINGGGWLTVEGTPVDILLRETGRVESVLQDCAAGRITIDYQCGHPFGFVNTIYAAETHFCKPLWEGPDKRLGGLKDILGGGYPEAMRRAVMEKFMWEAGFSLDCGRKAAKKGDVHYATGSVFRAVGGWTQALYAFNRRYLMNEKGSVTHIGDLKEKPEEFFRRTRELYLLLAQGNGERAYALADGMHAEIGGMLGGGRQPC